MTSEPFKARYLPVNQWPFALQRQWADAITEADLFEASKPATFWRKATVRKNRSDPPPLNWSTLKYVLWQRGGSDPCRGSVINPKRS
jgi:hypothetical protein